MAQARVVILGGGFGGLGAAYILREDAERGLAVDLLLIDASPAFMMGLRKLWLVDGRGTRAEGTRLRSRLAGRGLPFRQGRVEGIDLDAREVRVDGAVLPYDYLIVGLGAQPRLDLIRGLDEPATAYNLYDADDAERLGARLRDLDRGRVVIAIAGLPYKCPPAPYEAAFLIDDLLRRTGRRARVDLQVLTPQPMSLPVAGPAACAVVEGALAEHGIAFRPNATVERIQAGRVSLAGGGTVDADVVILVPPHRPPPPVRESGLTGEGEWVRVNPDTLATAAPRVFAVGDAVELRTGAGQPFPKAGIFAERQGEVAARNVAALVAGQEPAARFDGTGYCFIELGGGRASLVRGDFYATPPAVELADPAPEHLAAKVDFERSRLERWFG